MGGWRWEVGGGRWEVGGGRWEVGGGMGLDHTASYMMEQLLRKKALEYGQKLLEKDVKWKESLTKAVEKVESVKKQVSLTLF